MNYRNLFLFLFLFTLSSSVICQDPSGYSIDGNSTTFIFQELDYGNITPDRVVVTGSFRGWSQDMDDPMWNLKKGADRTWKLVVNNPDYALIPPRAEFKYRIDEGKWMSPPPGIINEIGGNLVYQQNVEPPMLKAEIRNEKAIWIQTMGIPRSLDINQYRLSLANGTEIPLAEILPNTSEESLIIPSTGIDITRVYYLEIPQYKLKAHCSFDGWFRSLYSHKKLGANISSIDNQTSFRIFSPRSTAVKLYLYHEKDDESAYQTIDMKADSDRVWEAIVEENLAGKFYDFTVHGHSDPGNHFYESLPKHISDPYARSNDEAWGRSQVMPATRPATPLKNGIPKMEDVVAYEVHIQDFTDLLPVGDDMKGTIPAMHMPGLKNKYGESIGFDHLRKLGINTVHLMPVQEFMHHPDDVWKESFSDDAYMIEQGVSEENYQWGYRTSHCFAIENKFRKKGTPLGAEREQLRDLVQAFHDEGMAVIVDIVPNHTAEDMDGNWYFHMNVLDKQYYYRTKDLDHIGEYGNEVKTENRPMVQKWLIDQCQSLIEEMGIDGFRIDLAGQIDKQTLHKLKHALGPDIIVYGEPWIASNDPDYENNPSWDWYKHDSPITYFNDDGRNALKGPVFDLSNKATDLGYPGGKSDERINVMMAVSGNFSTEYSTRSSINYLDIHDNWALADQFAVSDWDGRKGVEQDRMKIAATLLFTSLGPIVMHGGTEFMRSKGDAPLKEVVKTMKNGVTMYFHGKRDTYNLRKANQFKWDNIGAPVDPENKNDYKGMLDYWAGLIALRKSEVGKVFRIEGKPDSSYHTFYTPKDENGLAYLVGEKVFVAVNVGEKEVVFKDVYLPKGTWNLIADNERVDPVNGISSHGYSVLPGDRKHRIGIPAVGLKIWIKEQE